MRAKPADAKLRVFLAQLLLVLGQWERSLNQLNVASELDAGALAMARTYQEAVRCETLRTEVFAGKRTPLVFGDPQDWIALALEALARSGAGAYAEAAKIREEAWDAAPATAGAIDGKEFDAESAFSITRMLTQVYPLSIKHVVVDSDTSNAGLWHMSEEETRASARVFDTGDGDLLLL